MKEFYQGRVDKGQYITVLRNCNYTYPAHFHLDLEVLLIKKGRYDISIGNKSYCVTDGGIAIMDSYDIHSYGDRIYSEDETDDCVVIFPYRYLRRFNEWRKNLKIAEPLLFDEKLCGQLIEIVEKYMVGSYEMQEAAADLFFSLLYEKLTFKEGKEKDEGVLVRKILSYIQDNFRGDISRQSIAKALGYTEAHISRVFNKYVGKGISEYINELRLTYIDQQRAAGCDKKSVELIYEAGFKSQQTYYRVRSKHRV